MRSNFVGHRPRVLDHPLIQFVMRAVHARAAAGRRYGRAGRVLWPVVAAASVVVALVILDTVVERPEAAPAEMAVIGTFAVAWRITRRIV